MRLFLVRLLSVTALVGLVSATAGAAMVDFEPPTYTAGSSALGVDGWADFLGADAVITPSVDESRVLLGSQSMRLTGARSIVTRPFDAGPIGYDTGTIVKSRMLVDDTAGGTGELYFSHNIDPVGSSTPAGIVGVVGGNFELFCFTSPGVAGNLDTGVPFAANSDYLLEIELDLDAQVFNAFATDMTSGGSRTSLGTAAFALAGNLLPGDYATSGFALISRNVPVVFDGLDVDVVLPDPVDPLLPEPIDFEDPIYVAGSSVLGVDGWGAALESAWGAADATIVDTGVLEGTKSLRLTGSADNAALQRNFGEGTTYDTGSILSTKMMLEGAAGASGELYFSHDQLALATPGGIAGTLGGNFDIFGVDVVPANTVACEVGVEYLLEVELDLENQTFDSYVTNLTAGGARTLLGEAGLYAAVAPGDGTNAGFVIITRGSVGIFDELNLVPEPTSFAALASLLFAVLALRRRH